MAATNRAYNAKLQASTGGKSSPAFNRVEAQDFLALRWQAAQNARPQVFVAQQAAVPMTGAAPSKPAQQASKKPAWGGAASNKFATTSNSASPAGSPKPTVAGSAPQTSNASFAAKLATAAAGKVPASKAS